MITSNLTLNMDCLNGLAHSEINRQQHRSGVQHGNTYISEHVVVRINDHKPHNQSFTNENSSGR